MSWALDPGARVAGPTRGRGDGWLDREWSVSDMQTREGKAGLSINSGGEDTPSMAKAQP